ncbi:MAG TPA: RNA polymerase sigma factor [Micromonosporaceae bacterium]
MDGSPRHASPAGPTLPSGGLAVAIARAQDGDEDAFRSLYQAVQPGLLRYLRGLVGQDAEDVASEAWSQIARDLPGFRGDEQGFRAWAATVGRNRALDHLRLQRRRPLPAGMSAADLTDRPALGDTAREALDRVATDEAIALIAALPPDQAEAVLLRAVMGLDAVTAAQVLGKRPGAVRTAAHRGLRRLAQQLSQHRQDTGTGDPAWPTQPTGDGPAAQGGAGAHA